MREIDGAATVEGLSWSTVPLLEWSKTPDLPRVRVFPARSLDRAPVPAAVRALEGLDSLDWPTMSAQEQLDAVAALGAARSLLDGAIAGGLSALHRCGAAEADSGLRTVPWYARVTGEERTTGRRLLADGRTLERFERFAQAFRDRRCTMDHVRVLTAACNPRVLDQLIAADAELTELASTLTVEAWRDALRLLVASLDADGPEPSSDHDRVTAVRVGEQLVLDGDLSGDQAIVFEQALGDEYRRQLLAANTEATAAGLPVPPPATLRARALVELVRRGHQVRADGTPLTRGATEAKLVVREDHLGDHIGGPGEPDGGSEADRIQRGRVVTTTDGAAVDPLAAAVLLCDSVVRPFQVDDKGRILWGGRRRRAITHAQRAALAIRDGGCVFPDCDAPPSWCDGHHVEWWRDGGPSDIDNLVLLCRRHHGYAHSNDWTLEPDPGEPGDPTGGTQQFTWTHHPGDGAHARVMPATNARTRHLRHSVLLSQAANLDSARAGPP